MERSFFETPAGKVVTITYVIEGSGLSAAQEQVLIDEIRQQLCEASRDASWKQGRMVRTQTPDHTRKNVVSFARDF